MWDLKVAHMKEAGFEWIAAYEYQLSRMLKKTRSSHTE
jgi:hypothetical protein